jgi:hypothetical protein
MTTNLTEVSSISEITTDRLRSAGIRFGDWGTAPNTKTLDDFIGFCRTGEYELDDSEDILKVRVNVAVVFVRCVIFPRLGELYEAGQYRNGTRIANRRSQFDGSVAEKIKIYPPISESAEAAIRRGLAEELGQTEPRFKKPDSYELRFDREESLEVENADWFPGIPAVYVRRIHACIIPNNMCHKTYEEVCPDGRVILFRWDWKEV